MYRPEYNGKSIVNLMSSIFSAVGSKSPYPPLSSFDSRVLSESTNLLFIAFDGMGFEFLRRYGQHTVLWKHLREKLTSVFPSTTATAITTFVSGLSTQEHAITGWYMYLKELGVISTILPFAPRYHGPSFGALHIDPGEIYDFPSIFDHGTRKSIVVTSRSIINSEFTNYLCHDAERHGYSTLRGFVRQVLASMKSPCDEGKFVYAYWPGLDKCAHEKGVRSRETVSHLQELDQAVTYLLRGLKGTDSTVMISSDHGLIDAAPEHVIDMNDHPRMRRTLTMPLCGEPRVPYCYVRPTKIDEFLTYVHEKLPFGCDVFTCDELMERNFFGLYSAHPKLRDRLGDYVLIPEGSYVLRDAVLGENPPAFAAYHGGMTDEEMFVPLIVMERI
jgi:hypothetical protein